MRRLLLALLVVVVVPAAATAANQPHPILDAVATEVAGKPVSVWCEVSERDWDFLLSAEGLRGWDALGYTKTSTPTVYLAPRVCITLRTIIDHGYRTVGPFWASLAIKVLLHEGVHQRGITDEKEADCGALQILKSTAVARFGYSLTRTEPRTKTVMKVVRRKVGGKIITFRVQTQVIVQTEVPDPDLNEIYGWALGWHNLSWSPC